MSDKLPVFARLPSAWINEGGLRAFSWKGGSDETAALMLLIAIAHHADPKNGLARLTYDRLMDITHISRAKVAAGIPILIARDLIDHEPAGRSSFGLTGFGEGFKWGKLPVRGLYSGSAIAAFTGFSLRSQVELTALKLYILFAGRRWVQHNMALISYEKIHAFAGIPENRIKAGISLLVTHDLVRVERFKSNENHNKLIHGYRLTHVDAHNHLGTMSADGDGLPIEMPGYVEPGPLMPFDASAGL